MLLTTLDPEALLGRILNSRDQRHPGSTKGPIYLVAQDTGQLEMRASIGYTDPRIQRIHVPAVWVMSPGRCASAPLNADAGRIR